MVRGRVGLLVAGAAATVVGVVLTVGPAMAVTVIGTPGDDELVGTRAADVIRAGAGNDRVDARAGDDVVVGGPGDDLLVLGAGADRATGGLPGRDRVYGGPGSDVVGSVAFADLGRGNDTYRGGGRGFQQVLLGRGHDRVTGGYSSCDVQGGPGNDRISWWGVDDDRLRHVSVLRGGPGADRIRGGYNADRIYGGDGPDVIQANGSYGDYQVHAGPGDDVIYLLEANGVVGCGLGTDTVHRPQDGGESLIIRASCEILR